MKIYLVKLDETIVYVTHDWVKANDFIDDFSVKYFLTLEAYETETNYLESDVYHA